MISEGTVEFLPCLSGGDKNERFYKTYSFKIPFMVQTG